MTHNCCSLLRSLCSFVIRACIHFSNWYERWWAAWTCMWAYEFFFFPFFLSLCWWFWKRNSACALMFRVKLLKATKVVAFVRAVCVTKKSKWRTIPINDEMKRFWSEMENEKCRERMIDEDETSQKQEREREWERDTKEREEAFQATSSCITVLTLLLYSSASCGTGKCSWRLSPPAWMAAGSGVEPKGWSEQPPRPPTTTHTDSEGGGSKHTAGG